MSEADRKLNRLVEVISEPWGTPVPDKDAGATIRDVLEKFLNGKMTIYAAV